ncbi:MAG: type II secretion system F family protein [Alphaproteobacteria bacterium]
MAGFRYIALDAANRIVRGDVEAADRQGALETLRARGLRPTQVKASAVLTDVLHTPIGGGRVLGARDLIETLDELAMLVREGVSLKDGLSLAADLRGTRRARALLKRLEEALTEGHSLADAMDREPRAFPRIVRALVRAGEESGALAQVLTSMSAHMRRTQQARIRIISALTYPAILLLATIASIILMMTVVVPQFEPVFAAAGAELPTATRVLLGVAHGVQAHGQTAAIALAAGLLLLAVALRDEGLRLRLGRLASGVPYFGALASDAVAGAFARTLSLTLRNGVPLLRALEICRATVTEPVMSAALEATLERVRKGRRLGSAFEETQLGPVVLRRLVVLGEQSGQYDVMLERAADLLDQRVERRIALGLTLLVPLVTVIMGLVVGGTMYAIFSAVFAVNTLV